MSKAIRIHRNGGPEVLTLEEVEVGDPGPGQLRLRQSFIGINFIDTYQRSGLYKVPVPFTPGSEGAGVVEAVGPGVSDVQVGDRVAYAGVLGAYAEVRLIPADRVVPLPAHVDDRTAAAVMLKGMTAQYLVRQVRALGPSDTILFHAAAGGVGLLATQWARSLGVPLVIGTAGSPEKAALAREHGCHDVVEYKREDFVPRVKEHTGGKGVNVVYDSVGKDTFMRSLDCLSPRGMLVSFGQASGPVPPFDILTLSKGSLSLTRPVLYTFVDTREKLLAMASDLFGVLERGEVKVKAPRVFPLADAAAAQTALESRQTVGSTLLAI
jgi:NADPH2:quinone reductase